MTRGGAVATTPHRAIAGLAREMGGAHRHSNELAEVDALAVTKLRCAFPKRRRKAPINTEPRRQQARGQTSQTCRSWPLHKREGHTAPLPARQQPNRVPRDAAGPPKWGQRSPKSAASHFFFMALGCS